MKNQLVGKTISYNGVANVGVSHSFVPFLFFSAKRSFLVFCPLCLIFWGLGVAVDFGGVYSILGEALVIWLEDLAYPTDSSTCIRLQGQLHTLCPMAACWQGWGCAMWRLSTVTPASPKAKLGSEQYVLESGNLQKKEKEKRQ
jgi:hypothetical protein